MSGATASIVLANIAYALIGVGLAAAIGVFDRRRSSLVDALLGIPLGIAVVLLLSGYAAVIGVRINPTAISVLALAAIASGAARLPSPAGSRSRRAPGRGSSWS